MFGGPEVSYHQTYSARDWSSILRTPYPTQNLQRKHRTDTQTELAFTLAKSHKTESLLNHTTTNQKEREQLEDRRNVGESSCNFGDGRDQRVQFLMFMMMLIMTIRNYHKYFSRLYCRDMVRAASHRSVIGETLIRSYVSPCEVYVGQNGGEHAFLSSISGFPT